jgi:hypothetical protein
MNGGRRIKLTGNPPFIVQQYTLITLFHSYLRQFIADSLKSVHDVTVVFDLITRNALFSSTEPSDRHIDAQIRVK